MRFDLDCGCSFVTQATLSVTVGLVSIFRDSLNGHSLLGWLAGWLAGLFLQWVGGLQNKFLCLRRTSDDKFVPYAIVLASFRLSPSSSSSSSSSKYVLQSALLALVVDKNLQVLHK